MGLIPAHAGKTVAAASSWGWQGAHPRSRGENSTEAPLTSSVMGSSPLTRGKPRPPKGSRSKPGLIPTHAGKTTACPAARPAGRAHPRSRGENRSMAVAFSASSGSSPLTRGKRACPDPQCAEPGLIPAHAGKTYRSGIAQRCSWAHPRSRGENPQGVIIDRDISGSSPLTRGKRPAQQPRPPLRGLIPAHAGKT